MIRRNVRDAIVDSDTTPGLTDTDRSTTEEEGVSRMTFPSSTVHRSQRQPQGQSQSQSQSPREHLRERPRPSGIHRQGVHKSFHKPNNNNSNNNNNNNKNPRYPKKSVFVPRAFWNGRTTGTIDQHDIGSGDGSGGGGGGGTTGTGTGTVPIPRTGLLLPRDVSLSTGVGSGGGGEPSVGPPSEVSDAGGVADSGSERGDTAGAVTVTAAVTGTAASPSTSTAPPSRGRGRAKLVRDVSVSSNLGSVVACASDTEESNPECTPGRDDDGDATASDDDHDRHRHRHRHHPYPHRHRHHPPNPTNEESNSNNANDNANDSDRETDTGSVLLAKFLDERNRNHERKLPPSTAPSDNEDDKKPAPASSRSISSDDVNVGLEKHSSRTLCSYHGDNEHEHEHEQEHKHKHKREPNPKLGVSRSRFDKASSHRHGHGHGHGHHPRDADSSSVSTMNNHDNDDNSNNNNDNNNDDSVEPNSSTNNSSIDTFARRPSTVAYGSGQDTDADDESAGAEEVLMQFITSKEKTIQTEARQTKVEDDDDDDDTQKEGNPDETILVAECFPVEDTYRYHSRNVVERNHRRTRVVKRGDDDDESESEEEDEANEQELDEQQLEFGNHHTLRDDGRSVKSDDVSTDISAFHSVNTIPIQAYIVPEPNDGRTHSFEPDVNGYARTGAAAAAAGGTSTMSSLSDSYTGRRSLFDRSGSFTNLDGTLIDPEVMDQAVHAVMQDLGLSSARRGGHDDRAEMEAELRSLAYRDHSTLSWTSSEPPSSQPSPPKPLGYFSSWNDWVHSDRCTPKKLLVPVVALIVGLTVVLTQPSWLFRRGSDPTILERRHTEQRYRDYYQRVLDERLSHANDLVGVPNSPQNRALRWVASQNTTTVDNFRPKYILATVLYGLAPTSPESFLYEHQDECTWPWVECRRTPDHDDTNHDHNDNDENDHDHDHTLSVTKLLLSQKKLEGVILEEITCLPNLTTLDVSSNRLKGTIPEFLGKLVHMGELRLNKNLFEGLYPAFLGKMEHLEILDLSRLRIQGTIHHDTWNLPKLRTLILHENRGLTGTLPRNINALKRLEHLDITDCDFWSSIPTEIGDLSALEVLYIDSLDGSIPTEIGNLQQLKKFEIKSSSITGHIPTQLGNLHNLEYLGFFENMLRGTIPSEIGNLRNLTNFQIEELVNGTLPTEMQNMRKLEKLWIDSTRISGSLPSELGLLTRLKQIHLEKNDLKGTIPTELGNLKMMEDLDVIHTQLSGSLPSELHNWGRLKTMHLLNNNISGSLPSELGLLKSLHSLDVHGNKLSGTIPSELGQIASLRYVFVCDENEMKQKSYIPRQWVTNEVCVWTFLQTYGECTTCYGCYEVNDVRC